MSELQPVRLPSPGLRSGAGFLGAFLLGALLVAIIKPWGTGGPVAVLPSPGGASPTPGLILPSPGSGGFNALDYDASIFGLHEPAATWAIWPAGYLVTFGFVIQLSGEEVPGASSSPSAGRPSPRPSASGQISGPVWPTRFDVPEGNHLFLIGVNMPIGFSLASFELLRLQTDGTYTTITSAELASPWPSHFAVLGIPDAGNASHLLVWTPGVYRLQMSFGPGGISRSIEIHIGGTTVP